MLKMYTFGYCWLRDEIRSAPWRKNEILMENFIDSFDLMFFLKFIKHGLHCNIEHHVLINMSFSYDENDIKCHR